MTQYLFSGGVFMIPIALSLFLLIYISLKNLKIAYHTDKIILIGAITAIFGIISTGIGIKSALGFFPDISEINPSILWNGLKTSLVTTFSGGFILLLSTLLWIGFSRKHKIDVQ
tara:strand:- start:87 stop:428 length:342 start_codon:yes stop_codon:yes gene_type:complete